MMFRAEVKVSLKKGVLDPQGSVVEGAIKSLGYTGVPQVRIGKLVELWVEAATEDEARRITDELGRKILINPIMETYTFTLSPSAEKLPPAAGVK